MENARLKFRPRARLIRTIGDRLISGPETAVIELIKNSHDADATEVTVKFHPPLKEGAGEIVVSDNGHGMSLADIQSRWMEPATTDKVIRRKSPKGRALLGSKGIGRFATARLGRFLRVETTAKGDDKKPLESTVIPEIDWQLFDDATYLEDVSFDYQKGNATSPGTRLTISALRDGWNKSSLETLHRELRRLISPIKATEIEDFRIYLDLSACMPENSGFDGQAIVNGPLGSLPSGRELHRIEPLPLLQACDYEVDGEFDPAGHFTGFMTIHRGGLRPERIDLSVPFDRNLREQSCGLVLIHFYIFDREANAVQSVMQRAGMGSISAAQARELLDQISGVAIYRDKFRIRPYGDPANDWLTLDTRRVQNPSMRIGHNQISGIVLIDSEYSSGLIERSSREGLEENGHYRRLQRQITQLFAEVIEPRRSAFRTNAEIDRKPLDPFRRAYESAKFQWAAALIEGLPESKRQEVREAVAKEGTRLTEYLAQVESRQAILEEKVTLGLILGEVLHEGQPPVAYLYDQSTRLERWWPTFFDKSKDAEAHRERTPAMLRGMTQNALRLADLFRSLRPLTGGKRGKPTYYNPIQVVLDVSELFKSRLMEIGATVHNKAAADVPDILGYKADLAASVTNLFDNAIYWLHHRRTKHPVIEVNVRRAGDKCIIEIADNGAGISAEFKERIFDVGFTLKPNGTGLGLSIAREAIARSNGTLELVDSEVGACFRITLPFKA